MNAKVLSTMWLVAKTAFPIDEVGLFTVYDWAISVTFVVPTIR